MRVFDITSGRCVQRIGVGKQVCVWSLVVTRLVREWWCCVRRRSVVLLLLIWLSEVFLAVIDFGIFLYVC